MRLQADPAGLAPERLLVFELTGTLQNFARAVRKIPGLELISEEDLDEDEADDNPVMYLLVPNEQALRNLTGLWKEWLRTGAVPYGYATFRDMFGQLRDIRPWGPQDRVTEADRAVLADPDYTSDGRARLELELVFQHNHGMIETAALEDLTAAGGQLISRCLIDGAAYHALLVEVPESELAKIRARDPRGLAGAQSVMYIRPQSILDITSYDIQEEDAPLPLDSNSVGDPIAAVFDAVPLAGHPLLTGKLIVDDHFDLERLAAGVRRHGTAMASGVIHGDLNAPAVPPLRRPVYFMNVMYAPAGPDPDERFPDRLPADMFNEAVVLMKEGAGASAPSVIVINVSLGDQNKPFAGRVSGWARVLDYLAYRYGLLFVVSAGNQLDDLTSEDYTTTQFEDLSPEERAASALKCAGAAMAHRRVLAPAESINSLTVGSLNKDEAGDLHTPISYMDVWADTGLAAISSSLGPGPGGATKPDVLAPGGRHHVHLLPHPNGHRLRPLRMNAAAFGGILAAAPQVPTAASAAATMRSVGTSIAAAATTGMAVRAHENLEAVYADFLDLPSAQRALLLKALLVHSCQWTDACSLIKQVIGPTEGKYHYRQKDNIRRFLGYGALDPNFIIECTEDRATMWAVGSLDPEQAHHFAVPWPTVMSGKAKPHSIMATLSWFAPPSVGSVQYRRAKLKLMDNSSDIQAAGVVSSSLQPDPRQAHKGTVVHRRWEGSKAAGLAQDGAVRLHVQREPDQNDDPIPFALVVTLRMPTENQVYTQIRQRLAIRPRVGVRA